MSRAKRGGRGTRPLRRGSRGDGKARYIEKHRKRSHSRSLGAKTR